MGSADADIDAIADALARLRGRGRFGHGRGRAPHDHAPHDHGGRGGHHGHRHGGSPAPENGGRFPGAPGFPGSEGPGAGRFGAPARLRMLEALVTASAPLSVSEVGEAIGVDQPRASRLIQQSVELGLVRREADPADARRTRIALTDEGRAVVDRWRGRRRESLGEALAGFSETERADLARLLAKLADAWPQR